VRSRDGVTLPQWLVVAMNVGGERRAQHVDVLRQVGDRLAIGSVARAVNRLDGARLKVELARRVGQRRTAEPLVLDLLLDVGDFVLGALDGDLALELSRNLGERLGLRRCDVRDLDDRNAKTALHRRADLAGLQREGGVCHGAVDNRGFRHGAEIDVRFLEPAFGGKGLECGSLGKLVGGRTRLIHARKHDLPHVSALRRLEARVAILVCLLKIGIRYLDRGGQLLRRQHDQGDLAVFGRTEEHLALLEILGELLRRRRRNLASLRRPERDVFDRTLLVLEPVEGFQCGLRHDRFAADRPDQLLPQRRAALLGEEARLGVADIAERHFEAGAVELAGYALEVGVLGDVARDLGVAGAKAERLRPLVDDSLGNQLGEQLPVETKRAGLVRQDRAAEIAAKLLQAVLIELAESIDANLGASDLCQRGLAETAEDIADPPDAEADGDQAEDDAHDNAAEPIGGGFMNTSEHEIRSFWSG
jgi:hypothetical protein